MSTSVDRNRIVFLDHLRGLACLLVVFSHVYLMGINDPVTTSVWLPFVQGPIFGEGSAALNPFNAATTWLYVEAGISLGPLGVSIFFLISGYIILRTVDREAPPAFLVMRAFRIFPLCAFVSACIAVATAVLCWRYGGVSPHSVGSVAATGFAAPGIFGTFSTIPVVWSLTVEIAFYLLMAAAAACFGRIELPHIAALSLACGALSILSQLPSMRQSFPPAIGNILITLGYCAFHTSFLLIGSALYRCHMAGLLSLRSIAWIALVCGLYAALLALSIAVGEVSATGTTWQVGVLAFVVFVLSMAAGLRSRRLRWFTFFGDISYPLYLLHIPAAWAIMFVLANHGFGMHAATLTALTACVLASWVIRHRVEIPAHRAGRSLVARFRPAVRLSKA